FSDKGFSFMMVRKARKKAKEVMGEPAYKKIEPWLDCYLILSPDQACVVTIARRLRKWRC
ncbi:MAG: hypothetical protein J4F46_07375, partial [Dehalococcoidia bacterium]|nr:hypothetical protein [Dehalococcoidia bacterium]